FQHQSVLLPCHKKATLTQSAAPFLDRIMREVRPLCSTRITPLPRSYEPVRLPAVATAWLWIPTPRCSLRRAPRRVSQDPQRHCRRAPFPLAPDGLMGALARSFPITGRLRHLRTVGRSPWISE